MTKKKKYQKKNKNPRNQRYLRMKNETPTIKLSTINYQLSTITTMENTNKTLWSKILNIVITVLTAIATTFGVTSCMGV